MYEKEIVKKCKYDNIWIYTFFITFISYAYLHEPEHMNKAMFQVYRDICVKDYGVRMLTKFF
jgi:hypothetical protein